MATMEKLSTKQLGFHCQIGLANWRGEWSSAKREWCCVHEMVGCPTTPARITTGLGMYYPCWKGYSNFWVGWSAMSLSWCCAHEKLGCHTKFAEPTTLAVTTAVL